MQPIYSAQSLTDRQAVKYDQFVLQILFLSMITYLAKLTLFNVYLQLIYLFALIACPILSVRRGLNLCTLFATISVSLKLCVLSFLFFFFFRCLMVSKFWPQSCQLLHASIKYDINVSRCLFYCSQKELQYSGLLNVVLLCLSQLLPLAITSLLKCQNRILISHLT